MTGGDRDMECRMLLLTQADFDGELDAAAAAEAAMHRETCAACGKAYEDMAALRAGLRAPPLYHAAPESLRRALASRVRPGPAPWWRRPLAGAGLGAAIAAAIALLILLPGRMNLTDEIVDSHIRALQPGHLADVASSDRHTVKPWFAGRIGFAPAVKDLAGLQFPLTGGRLDYVGGHPAAVLVYGHGRHVIDLYLWPESAPDSPPAAAARSGYNAVHWIENGVAHWAVSDLEAGELLGFVKAWRAAP